MNCFSFLSVAGLALNQPWHAWVPLLGWGAGIVTMGTEVLPRVSSESKVGKGVPLLQWTATLCQISLLKGKGIYCAPTMGRELQIWGKVLISLTSFGLIYGGPIRILQIRKQAQEIEANVPKFATEPATGRRRPRPGRLQSPLLFLHYQAFPVYPRPPHPHPCSPGNILSIFWVRNKRLHAKFKETAG